MVIDTVNDVVLHDCSDTIFNTSGVAVRPFWWSSEAITILSETW